jgi:hypothetical protein
VSAKELVVRPIARDEANAFVCAHHVSRTFVRNSQVHLGAFLHGRLVGVLQLGPPLDKRKVLGLVRGTPWGGMLELNRLCFAPEAPRNSPSRALRVTVRLLQEHAPQVRWVLTFADATRSGDGCIYRAAGFLLTGIRKNTTVWTLHDATFADVTWKAGGGRRALSRVTATKGAHIRRTGGASMAPLVELGARPLPGFQVRYVKFLDPTWRDRLTVLVLDYAVLDEMGARMYRGRSVDMAATAGGVLELSSEAGGERPHHLCDTRCACAAPLS